MRSAAATGAIVMLPEWLVSLICGSLAFAIADVLCDVVISEGDEDEENDPGIVVAPGTPCRRSMGEAHPGYASLAQETPGSEAAPLPLEPSRVMAGGLSGAQDAAISGMVNVAAWLFLSGMYRLLHNTEQPEAFSAAKLTWWPSTHVECWLALLGGACAFGHDFFLLRAFEGAPSTVLLPLIQVASVSVLLGSSVVSLHRGERWISPLHAGAYGLMFVGGLLPATGGDVANLFRYSFWRQRYVHLAVLSEFSYGIHDLLASACSFDAHHHDGPDEVSPRPDFFVWSRCGYIATFAVLYLGVPSLHREFRQLFDGRISRTTFVVSGFSEVLALAGYYFMSRALGGFYQPAIVHAAEASLSQLLNLSLAFVLLRGCGVGRPSAVGSMRAKLLSFVLVTLGLLVCTIEDPKVATASSAAASVLSSAFANLTSLRGDSNASSTADPSASFYGQYPHVRMQPMSLPMKYGRWRHGRHGGGGHGGGRHRRARKARQAFFFHRGPD